MASDKDAFALVDPNKRYFAFNFAVSDVSDPNRFIERRDHLANQVGMLFPVKKTNFDFVFVSTEVLENLRDDGTSIVPMQSSEPLTKSLTDKQQALQAKYSVVCRAFSELLRFAPEEKVYKEWIDSNASGTPSSGDGERDRYCIFEPRWRKANNERLSAIKMMCNRVDIQKSPRMFFNVFRDIDLAMKELEMMEEQARVMKDIKEWVKALQKFYEETIVELETPYDIVMEEVKKGSGRRKDAIDGLKKQIEKYGIELCGPAKEFLMMKVGGTGDPLEHVCRTFRLPKNRERKKRSGKYEKTSRLELEKKICELDKRIEPDLKKIRDILQAQQAMKKERLKNTQ